jgi:hypothetical protein
MRGENALAARIRELVAPSTTEIVRIKRYVSELLSDGRAHRTGWLQRMILEREGVTPEPSRENVTVGTEAEIPTVAADHPVIARRRLLLGSFEAFADLQAQGIIVPVDGGPLGDEEDRSPPVLGGVQAVPYKYGSTGSGVRGIDHGRPAPADAYVLVQSYRNRDAWFLDVDVFAGDLSELRLDPRTIRCLRECLVAYRRGLYLAAANLLGAAVEGAWYTLAEQLRDRVPRLQNALNLNETAKVQRLVAERLGAERQELLAHAGFMRDMRNYGIHPRPAEREQLERYFTEETCAYLILTSYHHLRRLGEIAEEFRQAAAEGAAGSTDS